MRAHSESERSVGYVFLMHGRVPNYHYPTPTFRTVSLGSSVNRGNSPRQALVRTLLPSAGLARVTDASPEPTAPFALRLVRSTDVLAVVAGASKNLPVERLPTTVRSIIRADDRLYEIVTDAGTVRARWVFDGACGVAPAVTSAHRPRAVLSGTGICVEADRPVFDAGTATLFGPLDERSFAYVLPLSRQEALLGSASFGPTGVGKDRAPLLRYLRARHPDAGFTLTHSEHGALPLGLAPPATAVLQLVGLRAL
jgi:lycopene beta-cyclase